MSNLKSPISSALGDALWLTTALPIRLFGDPVLTTPCEPVTETEITSGTAQKWAGQLTNFLEAYRAKTGVGRGLAANQLGISKQIVLVWLDSGPKIYINPQIIETEGGAVYPEACISSASLIMGDITRAWALKLAYLTLNGDSEIVTQSGVNARVILHELDHLAGKICSDSYEPGTIKIVSGDKNTILKPELKRTK